MSGEWIRQAVRELPPSGIRAFFEKAAGDQELIQLGVGEPDFRVPESVRKACIRALNRGRPDILPMRGCRSSAMKSPVI